VSTRRRELFDQAAMEARLQQNAYDRFEEAAAEYFGVNRTDMLCLDVLDRTGQMTAGGLARETGLTTGAVTAMLDRVEKAGYVRRLPDPSDRRRVLVELTDKARQATREVFGSLADAVPEFDRYTDEQLILIRDFLRMGSDMLVVQAARVRELTRRRGRPGTRDS